MSKEENVSAQPGLQQESENHPSTSSSGSMAAPIMPASSISRPVFMPAVFTGVGRDWSDWLEQFELAATVNGWGEPVKLQFMSLLLSGHARDMYNGVSVEDKGNYARLKIAMTRCLEPCHSDEWSRVTFTERRRLPNETAQEFGNALRRLVAKAYPTVDDQTRDMLARDQFVTHFTAGDFRISLRAAKPKTLEVAIHLAVEMELLRSLEQAHTVPDARVREVTESTNESDRGFEALLGAVEGLRQEVKTIQSAVQTLQMPPKTAGPPNFSSFPRNPQMHAKTTGPPSFPARFSRNPNVDAGAPPSDTPRRRPRNQISACWECGCDRHLRRDCPYVQGN